MVIICLTITIYGIITCSTSDPYTQYHVKVSARTSAGYGNYSVRQNPVTTLEAAPGGSITQLAGTPVNTTAVKLTWSDPENPNGKMTSRKLFNCLLIASDFLLLIFFF